MEMIRTTVELPKDLYIQAKLMAIFTEKPMSHLIRIAVAEKIKSLKEEHKNNKFLCENNG